MSQDDFRARQDQAIALHRAGRLVDAETAYRALMAERLTVTVVGNLGSVLRALDRPDEAIPLLKMAADAAPNGAAEHFNLANGYRDAHRWIEAETAYRRAIALAPKDPWPRLNLGHLLLSLGQYEEGWKLYETRIGLEGQATKPLAVRFPMWRGEDLTGKSILLGHEQGFGDHIMFARFIGALRARGAVRIALICHESLAPLMRPLVDEIIVFTPRMEIFAFDYWSLPGSLPRYLGLTLRTLSGGDYLAAPAPYRETWGGFAGPGFNVGLVWHGNPRQVRDRYRSLPDPALLRPLRDCGADIIDLQEPRGDFGDTAAIVEQLDLVITVDTATAHLAGALGRPCWIMYPWAGTDWRWMWDRTDSPWYDSVRLYRQTTHGDWAGVIDSIAHDLKAAVAAKTG